MGFGDLEARYTLDDSKFQRGLGRVEQEAARHSERMGRTFRTLGLEKITGSFQNIGRGVMLGVGASIAIATKGVQEYAKASEEARDSVDRLQRAQSEIYQTIGILAIPLVDELTARIKDIGTAVEWLSTLDWGFIVPGAVKEYLEAGRESIKMQAEQARKEREQRQLEEQDLRVLQAGKDRSAAEEAQIDFDRQERMRGISKFQEGPDKERIKRAIDAEMEARRKAIRDSRAEQDAKAAEDAAKAREAQDNARAGLSIDLRKYAIDNDRLSGKTREAALDQERLEVEQKILAIRKNANLTDAEKSKAEDELNRMLEDRLAILGNDSDTRRAGATRIGLGQAGIGIAGQIIGGAQSQTVDVFRRVLARHEDTNKILKSIDRKVGTGGTMVYAN